jgi:hypothetical protein
MVTTASDTSDGAASGASIGARALDGQDTIAPALLRRLDRLMSVERIYRQEGLTIAMLAVKLDVPQHRLRQAINEGLGHRNFNAFLNRYRIDEAKASLSDASQRDVPVLTGLTPTEFRRDALAASHARASKNDDDAQIGERNREIG